LPDSETIAGKPDTPAAVTSPPAISQGLDDDQEMQDLRHRATGGTPLVLLGSVPGNRNEQTRCVLAPLPLVRYAGPEARQWRLLRHPLRISRQGAPRAIAIPRARAVGHAGGAVRAGAKLGPGRPIF